MKLVDWIGIWIYCIRVFW